MDLWIGFSWGLLGGALPEFIKIYKLREVPKGERPHWLGSPFYWSSTGVMVVLGGALPALYASFGTELNPLLAINLGASAPILIERIVGSVPDIPPGSIK